MLPLFLATCSIVIGLGMVVPLLPFYAVSFGASATDVAWLFAIYSACQFLVAPLWGRLSARVSYTGSSPSSGHPVGPVLTSWTCCSPKSRPSGPYC